MKCDELEFFFGGVASWAEVYKKSDVDAAIAELKREHHLERHEYIEMVAQIKKKLVEQKAENDRLKKEMDDYHLMSDIRRAKIKELKRDLWLARAERAADRARIFYFNDLETKLDIEGFSYDSKKKKGCKKMTARLWRIIWLKVERKCLKKAEEYK